MNRDDDVLRYLHAQRDEILCKVIVLHEGLEAWARLLSIRGEASYIDLGRTRGCVPGNCAGQADDLRNTLPGTGMGWR